MAFPEVRISLDTSKDDIITDLLEPGLKWAERYDRGVGFFTTGWLTSNLSGMSEFASHGGKMRLITSPILSNDDSDAIINSEYDNRDAYARLETALLDSVKVLEQEMGKDILNAFSWMLYDRIIDMRFAIPRCKLNDGDFHAKFGIFYSGDEALSYSGSMNDSKHGFQNYETITVFKSWAGTKEYVEIEIERFNRIWDQNDANLNIYTIPSAVKSKIFSLRTSDRPYKKPENQENNKWIHQEQAVECFLEKEHGILAMATGTGKTVTALKIIDHLFEESRIKRVIITMYGNDLLEQWAKQVRDKYQTKQIFYQYESNKMMNKFIMHPDNSILLVSRDSNNLSNLLDSLERLPGNYKDDTLFVFDEVHGAGAPSIVENLTGRISPYRYRLGLSATPEREYDDEGNEFILNEIGEVVFEFSLKDAITKGILCEFNYIPLNYKLSPQERKKKKDIIAAFSAKRKSGIPYNEKDMFTQLAKINKTALDKIDEFEKFISSRVDFLDKCIIFVETKDYGELLQNVLIRYTDKYHTYYSEDEKSNLENFSSGKIRCLLTCKKVSEGIDISSVTNIFLFASDRSKLVTTQRIGRALRLDKENPDKKANVIDFIISEASEDAENADEERMIWLTDLSNTRRNPNEE